MRVQWPYSAISGVYRSTGEADVWFAFRPVDEMSDDDELPLGEWVELDASRTRGAIYQPQSARHSFHVTLIADGRIVADGPSAMGYRHLHNQIRPVSHVPFSREPSAARDVSWDGRRATEYSFDGSRSGKVILDAKTGIALAEFLPTSENLLLGVEVDGKVDEQVFEPPTERLDQWDGCVGVVDYDGGRSFRAWIDVTCGPGFLRQHGPAGVTLEEAIAWAEEHATIVDHPARGHRED